MLLPFRLGLGGKQGSGKQWMSWIALDDDVAAIRAAIDDERLRGPVNLTAPNPVTNADFAHALGRALHRPTVSAHADVPAEAALRTTSSSSRLLLASQRVLPTRLEAIGFPFRYPVLAPALEAILRGAAECGSGSTPTPATIPTTRSRSGARPAPKTSTSPASAPSTATSSSGPRSCAALLPDVDVIAGPPPPERVANVDVLLGIGPWTHIADLADAGALPRRVVLMGGALAPVKHHGELRRIEHNVGADPEAAARLTRATRATSSSSRSTRPPRLHAHDARREGARRAGSPGSASSSTSGVRTNGDVPLVLHDVAALLVALGDRVAAHGVAAPRDRARRHDVGVGRRAAPTRRRARRRRRDARPDARASHREGD